MTARAFLDGLETAARAAEAAETACRREAAARIAHLERERAFAFRRLNLIRATAAAVADAESEATAVAAAAAALRARLGWSAESEARAAVLGRFAAVAAALFEATPPRAGAGAAGVASTLAAFELWYAETHETPFWTLFEHEIPETPLVDF